MNNGECSVCGSPDFDEVEKDGKTFYKCDFCGDLEEKIFEEE